jgi:hypothetical protein
VPPVALEAVLAGFLAPWAFFFFGSVIEAFFVFFASVIEVVAAWVLFSSVPGVSTIFIIRKLLYLVSQTSTYILEITSNKKARWLLLWGMK